MPQVNEFSWILISMKLTFIMFILMVFLNFFLYLKLKSFQINYSLYFISSLL